MAIVVAAGVLIWRTTEFSVAHDSRIVNRTPSLPVHLADGVGRVIAPVWGIGNWPLVLTMVFTAVPLVCLAGVAVVSIRQRRMSHRILVFLVIAALASQDTFGAWASFTIYNPKFAHFPVSWPWAGLSPSVQPVFTIIGYPFFYFTPGMLAVLMLGKVILPRARQDSVIRRHPLLAVFTTGVITMVLFDVPLELLSMRVDMYFYSQYFGPAVHWGYAVLPFMEVVVASFMTGVISVLLWEGPSGWTVMAAGAERFAHLFERVRIRGRLREYLVGLGIAFTSLLFAFGVWAGIRAAHVEKAVFVGAWHYQEIKTYDPYGVLAAHGKAGPYYRDFWQQKP
jgi:hypothetical protein